LETIYGFDVKEMPVTVTFSSDGASVHNIVRRAWQTKFGNTPVAVV
jgi:tartrate dehydratase beta subunit/fumarate hydratase class I family protein